MGLFGPPNIAKLKAKGDVPGLILALGHEDFRVREEAAGVLGEIADASAVEPLISAFKNRALISDAIKALGKIGDVRAVDFLIPLLDSSDKVEAAEALGKIGDLRALKPLFAAFRDSGWYTRGPLAASIEILCRALGPAAVPQLCAHLTSPASHVRDAAAKALEAMRRAPDRGSDGAAFLIHRRKWEECAALGEVAVGPLILSLGYLDSAQRRSAAAALVKIGQPAVPALAAALAHSNAKVREAAVGALDQGDRWEDCAKLGESVVDPLVALVLGGRSAGARSDAAKALGMIRNTRAVEALVAALDHTDGGVREACVVALGQIGDARAVTPLVAALSDRETPVRKAIVVALGQIGDTQSVEALVATLSSQSLNLRDSAANALDGLAWKPTLDEAGAAYWAARSEWDKCTAIGARAVGPLLTQIEDVEQTRGAEGVRDAAAAALSRIRDTDAVEPLIATLQKQDINVRVASIVALGNIGDIRAISHLLCSCDDKVEGIQEAARDALVEIGDPAVVPLISTVNDKNRSWDDRRTAAAVLLAAYSAGRLSEAQRLLILSQRERLARRRTHKRLHTDRGLTRCVFHEDSSCHVDEGFGLSVPV